MPSNRYNPETCWGVFEDKFSISVFQIAPCLRKRSSLVVDPNRLNALNRAHTESPSCRDIEQANKQESKISRKMCSSVVVTVIEEDEDAGDSESAKVEAWTEEEKRASSAVSKGSSTQTGKNSKQAAKNWMQTWRNWMQSGKNGKQGRGERQQQVAQALKVGAALGLVSLLLLLRAPAHWLGSNAIWANMTVIVVFESSVGATISKGLNRTVATVVAGFLAFGVEKVVDVSGHPWGAIFIGASVFLVAAVCTSMRFVPSVKAQYEYGVIIFMLTYSLILVSGYRIADDWRLAWERILVCFLGVVVCVATSMAIFPAWAGTDLHNAVVDNFDDLAFMLKECAHDFVKGLLIQKDLDLISSETDAIVTKCNAVLGSGPSLDSMERVALWEPFHGKFRFQHPWHEYVKVGQKLRLSALAVLTLDGCLRSGMQIVKPSSIPASIKLEMTLALLEASKLLKELGESIHSFHRCGNKKLIAQSMRQAASSLRTAIEHYAHLTTPKMLEHATFGYETKLLRTCRKLTIRRTNSCPSFNETKASLQDYLKPGLKLESSKPIGIGIIPDEISHKGGVLPSHPVTVEAVSFATFASLLDEVVSRLEDVVDVVDELGAKAKFDAVDDTPLVEIESGYHHGGEKTSARRRRNAFLKI